MFSVFLLYHGEESPATGCSNRRDCDRIVPYHTESLLYPREKNPTLRKTIGEHGMMLTIRPVSPADLDRIAALYVKNHQRTYRGLLPDVYFSHLTQTYAREKWSRFPEEPGAKMWAAYADGLFLGFSAGREDPELQGTWYLDSLHVTPEAQGKGVGTALIRENAAYAAGHGYSGMSVCIVRGNEKARGLYTRLGAEHDRDFEDDFCGTVSHSEKLIWKDLSGLCKKQNWGLWS